MMPIRSREEALATFDDHMDGLAEAFQSAMDDFYERCGPIAHALEGWTRAGIIRDLAKGKFLALTLSNPELRHHRRGNATSFSIGQFNMRIRQLDGKYRTKTRKTKASKAFDRNKDQFKLGFQDEQPATSIYFGYVPTENDPQHPPVFLVCNNETGKPAWDPIPVRRGDPPVVADIVPDIVPPSPSRVKVKKESGKRRPGNE